MSYFADLLAKLYIEKIYPDKYYNMLDVGLPVIIKYKKKYSWKSWAFQINAANDYIKKEMWC